MLCISPFLNPRVTINLGEAKAVDLDNDGTDDLEITLNNVDVGVADLSFKKIGAIMPVEQLVQPSMEIKTQSQT